MPLLLPCVRFAHSLSHPHPHESVCLQVRERVFGLAMEVHAALDKEQSKAKGRGFDESKKLERVGTCTLVGVIGGWMDGWMSDDRVY